MDITNISAYEIREKFINKEVRAVDIVSSYIEKIKREDPDLNAYISINEEEALVRARELDDRLARGEAMGSLAAVPVSIKDNISTKGIKTSCGSKMMLDYLPPFNATVIDLIEAEDGIILGKTNLDEFAIGSTTESSCFGPTKNPIAEGKIPGGSSGGSAVSVASKLAPLSLGTDTGGSVRQPAAYTSVVGIKPSYGAISRFGIASMANSMDQVGVLAGNVKDGASLLKVLMQKDPRDHTSYGAAGEILEGLDLDGNYDFKGMKIGLVRELEGYEMDGEILEALDRSVELIEKLGGRVEEVKMNYLAYASTNYYLLASAEASSNLARYDGIIYGHRSDDYKDLTELYTNSRTESFGDEVKKRIILGNYLLANENREDYYTRALKIRRLIKEEFEETFKNYDLILTPTTPILPFDLRGEYDENYDSNIFTTGVNLAGNCAMSLPVYKQERLPIGIQFIANRFEEDKLIRAGLAFEGGNIDEL